ncbi:MAG: replicative DNA helicase [Phycisphaerales bacterium]|nr:replicative DNA helicase [Phycisphaerales bacterium]
MDQQAAATGRADGARPAGDRPGRRRDAGRRAVADPAEVARLFSALPPSALEAEMSLLGSMIVDPKVIPDVIGIVSQADDFARAAHGTIFRHMVELYDATATMEIVSLVQRLKDHGVLEDVGGSQYLMDLAEGVATAANAAEYARLVREKATRRELIRAAGEILVDAHQSVGEASMVLGEAEARIFAIAQRREARSAATLRELLDETVKMIEASAGKHVTGVPTGFDQLDEMLSGLQKGEMVILAARPSMGKTAFALNITENMASSGSPVAFFSLEMGKQQLVQRILCAKSGVDGQKLRKGMVGKEEWRRLLGACDALQGTQIYIDDTPGLTLLQMRSKARRMREKFGIQAIVIDYLQLMSAGTRVESRQVEVSDISRGVKAMARELEVPVVCLSQLNRQSEDRQGHRPRMSDLRESGSIEQDADVVMMLHREEYYHQNDENWVEANPQKRNVAEVLVLKQRNGPTGTVELVWDSRSTAFRNLAPAGQGAGVVYGGADGDLPA